MIPAGAAPPPEPVAPDTAADVVERLRGLRIGYVARSADFSYPTDSRLFVHYARKRSIPFRVVREPEPDLDVAVLSEHADLTAWRRAPKSVRVLFILDNAYLSVPHSDIRGRLRGAAKYLARHHRHLETDYTETLRAMCRRADAMLTSTPAQQAVIRELCPNVHIMLAFHGSVAHAVKADYAVGERLNLVWEGLPGNVGSLGALAGPLEEMRRTRPVDLHVVTDPKYALGLKNLGRGDTRKLLQRALPVANVYLYDWCPHSVSALATQSDIAVIPIPLDNPLWAGKPANKLLLFWRMAVPAVVSATPAYRAAMEGAGQDLLCSTAADWTARLEALSRNEGARAAAGQGGREYAEREFGEAALMRRWDEVFASLID